MIRSMTSFARAESQQSWGNLTWEVKSVNHRYLEPQFKLPDLLRFLEPMLRDRLRKHLGRGKVECGLRYHLSQGEHNQLAVNNELVSQLLTAVASVQAAMPQSNANTPLDVLRWPGVLEEPKLDMESVQSAALTSFDATLQQLLEAREREGTELAKLISQRLQSIREHTQTLRTRLPEILERQRQRLLKRFDEIKTELDPDRLETELLIVANKSDVDEELDRLDTHVEEVQRVITKGGACGRRLDFLMQELNREANTLSSKSIDSDMTKIAVDLKVLIEQMREQVQNIE